MVNLEEMKERNIEAFLNGKKRFKRENAFIVSEINHIKGEDDTFERILVV